MDPPLAGLQWSAKRHKAFPFLSFGQGVCTHTGSHEPLIHCYPCSILLIPPSQSVKGTQARSKFRVLQATWERHQAGTAYHKVTKRNLCSKLHLRLEFKTITSSPMLYARFEIPDFFHIYIKTHNIKTHINMLIVKFLDIPRAPKSGSGLALSWLWCLPSSYKT